MLNFDDVGRNDPCPCGSGLKYKKCCMLKHMTPTSGPDRKLFDTYKRRYRIRLKTPKEIEGIRLCGKLVVDTLKMVGERIKPGITTNDINEWVHQYTIEHGATPAPLNYYGFPKSVCTSINEVICHGIPSDRVLLDGDIINIDVTSILNGYYADSNYTFPVGNCSPDALRLINVAKTSLKKALEVVRPNATIGDIGHAIQEYAENVEGCSVVRDYIGHGVGIKFHEPPDVPHYGRKGTGIPLVPGMVFTIEPMINLGRKDSVVLDDDWTAVTADGSLSAQFEQTLVVTEDGCEVLTPFSLDC